MQVMNAFARQFILGTAIALIAQSAIAATPEPKENNAAVAIAPEQFHREALAHPPAEVSPTTLAQWLGEQSVLLLDLRGAAEFQSGHLKGAINVPLTELTERHLEQLGIKKDARIVVYCDFQLQPTRRIALTTLGHPSLQQLGFAHVHTLEPLWQSDACRALPSGEPCGELLPWVRAENARAGD